jgi:DNA-binding NarL/FixJ family response regulator
MASSNPVEVLVVDDVPGAADEYAKLIEAGTGLGAVGTDDPYKAMNIVRSSPIKVVVLDQKMPLKTGTELFSEIHTVSPDTKAIMLTGQASGEEVGQALQLKFDDYLPKNRLTSLAARVELQYAKFHADVATRSAQRSEVLYSEKRWQPTFQHKRDYILTDLTVIDEAHVNDDSWVTTATIRAGEEKEEIDEWQLTNQEDIKYETSARTTESNDIGLSLPHVAKLREALELRLEERFSNSRIMGTRVTRGLKRKFSLPKESTDPNELHVTARQYQRAPVFIRIRATVLQICGCCRNRKVGIWVVDKPTRTVATRTVDFMSDGFEKQTRHRLRNL